MDYNLLTEPWIEANYLDGRKKEIGIITALKDAELIQEIQTPIFHNSKFLLHEFNVIILLSSIITSAYNRYFPEVGATRDYYIKAASKDGLYNELIMKYIDEFRDRFNLFDPEHPFLQDISVKNEKGNESYRTLLNPLAPENNNSVFGMVRAHKKNTPNDYSAEYDISCKELAYLLIYTTTISQITNGYTKSVSAKVNTFIMLKGANLKETILNNCIITTKEDQPIWELDSVSDYEKFETLNSDILACLYFPLPTLFARVDEKTCYIESIVIIGKSKTSPFKLRLGEMITENLLQRHPYALRREKNSDTDKTRERQINYVRYNNKQKAWMLCMSAVKDPVRFNRPMEICERLGREYEIVFYSRQYDDKIVTVLNCIKLEINRQPWLETEEGYTLAVEYKAFYERAQSQLKKALSVCFKGNESANSQSEEDKIKDIVSPYIENYFIHKLYDSSSDYKNMKQRAKNYIKNVFLQAYSEVLIKNVPPVGYIRGYSILMRLSAD